MKNFKAEQLKKFNELKNSLSNGEFKDYIKSKITFKDAWDDCRRGDWMLWFASNQQINNRKLTLAKGMIARTVIHLMTDYRSKKAVDAAIAYGHGKINEVELKKAADDVGSFLDSAPSSHLYTADDAAYISVYIGGFADDYNKALFDAVIEVTASTEEKTLKQAADICREVLTEDFYRKILAGKEI